MSNNQYAGERLSRTIGDLVDAAKSGAAIVFGTLALLIIGNKCSEIPIGERLVAVKERTGDEPGTDSQANNDKKSTEGTGGFQELHRGEE